ncbi:DUF3618 domain-containing protein [Paramicrobacterium agarici]|uniref:Uncharacterized protein DUF3618 n=1 Tax=Paramicrobacterium agarici TaxID=630514 RepID=A0A2A9DU44_9MICO|nr:DUF3618 domain-containing protein [Microbacterium agarici]PFG29492.1 uncharacterized protein DUF3618 [Microbacterium agarici]TQO22497.1 uncharacterized protein DUF3618 [Microbacterium agarici]
MTAEKLPTTAEARADLAATLDAIEDKLNVPKQAKATYERLREQNPAALVAGAAGVATAVGLGVWAVVRAVIK